MMTVSLIGLAIFVFLLAVCWRIRHRRVVAIDEFCRPRALRGGRRLLTLKSAFL